MKLQSYQLAEHLKKNLLPIYIVSGDEPLLVQEAKEAICQSARQAGFTGRQCFEASKDFDWNLLGDAINNLSLFNNKCLIEVKLTNKPGVQGGKILSDYSLHLPADKMLLIVANKLDQASQKTNWFQALLTQGAFVPIWPMDFPQLLNWIQQRLQQAGISANSAGIKLIAEYTEGNLLATSQEIMKLQLLYADKTISTEQIKAALSDHARYDVFMLADAILQGNAKRAIKILLALRQEGIELPFIIWVLTRDLRHLISLWQMQETGINLESIFQKLQIWSKRQPLFKNALRLQSLANLHRMLSDMSKIDEIIKGNSPGNAWNEIEQLILKFAGLRKN